MAIGYIYSKALMASLMMVLLVSPSLSMADITEQMVVEKLDLIRKIKVSEDRAILEKYNKGLDEAWAFFKANKDETLPWLALFLKDERKKGREQKNVRS